MFTGGWVPRNATQVADTSHPDSRCVSILVPCSFTSYPDQQNGDIYPNPYGYIDALYIGLNFV